MGALGTGECDKGEGRVEDSRLAVGEVGEVGGTRTMEVAREREDMGR